MKGRFFWGKRTYANLARAIEFFEQARQLDPDYALAYVGLADSRLLVGAYNPGPDTVRSEEMEKGRAAAREALRLNANLAEAYVSLAYIEFLYDWDWEAAERDFLKAIELDPSYAVAHQWYGEFLSVMGRHDEAIERTRRAVELEPTSSIISRELGYKFLMARRYGEAIDQFKKTIELDPFFLGTQLMLTEAYWYSGRVEEAVAQTEFLDETIISPRTSTLLYQLLSQGKTEEAIQRDRCRRRGRTWHICREPLLRYCRSEREVFGSAGGSCAPADSPSARSPKPSRFRPVPLGPTLHRDSAHHRPRAVNRFRASAAMKPIGRISAKAELIHPLCNSPLQFGLQPHQKLHRCWFGKALAALHERLVQRSLSLTFQTSSLFSSSGLLLAKFIHY